MSSRKSRAIRFVSMFLFIALLCSVFAYPSLRGESAPFGIDDVQKQMNLDKAGGIKNSGTSAQSTKKRALFADLFNDFSLVNQLDDKILVGGDDLQPEAIFGPVAISTVNTPGMLFSPSSPYPANFTVSGLTGGLVTITVVFNSITFSGGGAFLDDMDMLLVSPGPVGTAKAFIFWSDVGGSQVTNVTNVTVADTGGTDLPNNTPVASSTTYRPANYVCVDPFPPEAGLPSTRYSATSCGTAKFALFQGLSGTNLNGTWKLYIMDHSGDGGESVNVSLNITAGGPTAANANIGGQVRTSSGRGISKAIVTLSGGGLNALVSARTSPFGYYNFPEVPVGETYVLTVSSKGHTFANPTQVITLQDNVSNADFVSEGP